MQRPHLSSPSRTVAGRARRRLSLVALLAALTALALCTTAGAQERLQAREQPAEVPLLTDEVPILIDDLLEALVQMQLLKHRWHFVPFAETAIFFEENATDGDLGIQFFLDGEPWSRVAVYSPRGKRLVDVKVRGNAGVIGLTEFFSESAEPGFDDLPRDEFLALFDEGKYWMFGKSIEGELLFGCATLTKNLPEPLEITSPLEDEEVDAGDPLIVKWDPVPDPDAPDSVIVAYHVVVEKDEDDERLRVLTADMLPTDTCLVVAPGFLEPGKDYKVEILVIESSGNKTITEIPFSTAD